MNRYMTRLQQITEATSEQHCTHRDTLSSPRRIHTVPQVLTRSKRVRPDHCNHSDLQELAVDRADADFGAMSLAHSATEAAAASASASDEAECDESATTSAAAWDDDVSSDDESLSAPWAQTQGAGSKESDGDVDTDDDDDGTPAPEHRPTVGDIFARLGCPPVDAQGRPLARRLLRRHFVTGLQPECDGGMAETSGGRRELLTAAAALVYAVLDLLAPAPLSTAAALAVPPKRRADKPDPMRSALVCVAKPNASQKRDIITASDMAWQLVNSYVAATQRNAKMAEKAPILAALTGDYNLRLFNTRFETQLAAIGGPITRYAWSYATWHARIWLAGQTAPATVTSRWRLKSSGELGSLPHQKLLDAVAFLTSSEHLQHVAHGTRRVKLSDGSWTELSATERRQTPEALWRLYEAAHAKQRHVSRTEFLELAEMTAGTTQKSYGALDTFAEENGRQMAKEMRACCDEMRELVGSILTASLLPVDGEARAAQQTRGARVQAHAKGLSLKVTQVETHIKRGLAEHVPSCNSGDDADDDCPEHCRACAFGTSVSDGSRPDACQRAHTQRCVECATAHSLESDFGGLMDGRRRRS